jgi:hypothetical protein
MFISFLIIVIHYFADFIMQDEKWATNKSKSNLALLSHVTTYSLIWLVMSFVLFAHVVPGKSNYVLPALVFASVTFVTHFCTDWITSRITSKMFAEGKYGSSLPNWGAFSVIGLDQVLHYAQLFLTFDIICKNLL